MRGTGIIRRVDELGRIVIPKAIREELSIEDDCPLEYFIENGEIVLRKYVPEEGEQR